jgi:hypothetical protein
MTYEYLQNLKNNYTSLQLLNVKNFEIIVGFFEYAFKTNQTQTLKESEICTQLDGFDKRLA